ncbi:PIG-X-domain-containing protein [Viridothelium virens]|uniref:Protein PBN1 n=1 Tax=Viridothelium virens TaxID=1048519 RepID=A0A6A6HKA1_VIRVR|nr:PIG-X-domain-containing protein [Viridothelium virens]
MKQRITYLLEENDAEVGPEQIQVQDNSLSIHDLYGAKEHRVTLGLDELPQELRLVLNQCHELRIRWASQFLYAGLSPFTSRVSPGLHVFYTPRRKGHDAQICQLLGRVFGNELACESVERSFINVPILSERFSSTASFQYYSLWPSLKKFVTYVEHAVHESQQAKIRSLLDVNQLDVDCDIISHACILNAYWAEPTGNKHWKELIETKKTSGTLEVGILTNEKPLEPEELSLSGVLAVVGEDDRPKATKFSFPSRHHPVPASDLPTYFYTHIKSPAGLHPTLQLTFPSGTKSLIPPNPSCALHAHLTLPSTLLIDKYQLQDPLFLSSQRLRRLHSVAGETDLEAPNWAISRWGSAVLLELAHPSAPPSTPQDGATAGAEAGAGAETAAAAAAADWTVSIPLHLRYLEPRANASGMSAVDVPWPVVFWACAAEEGTKMGMNPFDRTNLGYDGLFGTRTMFYHVPPAVQAAALVERVPVPVLDLGRARYVELGTVVAVVVGFAWVVWKLLAVGGKEGERAQGVKGE